MSLHTDRSNNKNHFISSTPNVDNFSDKSHPQEVISSLNELVSAVKEYPRQEAERYFEIGCVLVKSSSELTFREMSKILNIHTFTLSTAKTIATKLECNKEKFIEILDRMGTWEKVSKEIMPRPKKNYKDILEESFKKTRAVAYKLKEDPSDMDALSSLIAMRDMLNRIIPPVDEIFDKNYLLYYPCVCCGVEAVNDGHTIKVHKKYDYLRYPFCNVCNDENNEPDMTLVAIMYANYAIITERAYNKIMNYA